jgi:integrase
MARRTRAAGFENRTNRLKLPVARKPVFVRIGPGVSLGYRRNATAGTWVVRVANGQGGNWTKAIANADDFAEANGTAVLDYWQAQARARTIAGASGGEDGADNALTVTAALERYKADLAARSADAANVARVRAHLPDAMARRPVALLTARELTTWRNGLMPALSPASANRVSTVLRAALNLVADGNAGISNRSAWDVGLKAIPDSTETRNVVLSDAQVREVVSAARGLGAEFGLLVETAAVTGSRISQIARLTVGDVAADHLTMPTSRKGRGTKKVGRRHVPVSSSLCQRLTAVAKGKPADAPLLTKPSGEVWKKSDHNRPFRRAAVLAKLDPDEATIYALRHSSITRQLVAGVPIRVVAAVHDTSVSMIEKTYSVGIDRHVDAIVRPALISIT